MRTQNMAVFTRRCQISAKFHFNGRCCCTFWVRKGASTRDWSPTPWHSQLIPKNCLGAAVFKAGVTMSFNVFNCVRTMTQRGVVPEQLQSPGIMAGSCCDPDAVPCLHVDITSHGRQCSNLSAASLESGHKAWTECVTS
jgi:hypothetical protein